MRKRSLTPGVVILEKLPVLDRIKQIADVPGSMINTDAVSFFTAYAYRLFRKKFYLLSVKIFDSRADAKRMNTLATARQDFLAGIEALASNYAAWHDLENTLTERRFTDVVELSPACTQLRQTFIKLDRFLVPPYLARTGGHITKVELALLTEDVNKLVKLWLASVDDNRIAAVCA